MKIYVAYKNLKGEVVYIDTFTMMSDVFTNIYNFAAKCNYIIPYMRTFQIGDVYTIDFGSHTQFYYYVMADTAEEAFVKFYEAGFKFEIPGVNTIICGLCGTPMYFFDFLTVNAWVCGECPAVTYEYYDKDSTIALATALEHPKRKVHVVQLNDAPPAFKFTLGDNTGFIVFQDPENYVLTYNGEVTKGHFGAVSETYVIDVYDAHMIVDEHFDNIEFYSE